jgi:hypothetical protein
LNIIIENNLRKAVLLKTIHLKNQTDAYGTTEQMSVGGPEYSKALLA